jgi:hypothetical protein
MVFCQYCGREIGSNASYCIFCGRAVSGRQQPQQGSVPPPASGPPYFSQTVQPAGFGDPDRYALNKLNLLAIVLLIGLVASYVLGVGFDVVIFSSLFHSIGTTTGTTPSTVVNPFASVNFTNLFVYLIVLSLVGAAIELYCLFQMRFALKRLSSVDRFKFGSPSNLILLAIIAYPFIFLGLGLEFGGMATFFSTFNPTQPLPPTAQIPFEFGYLIAGSVISGISGIIAIIGLIAGALLGLWRMGIRYGENTIKAAAILFIIPFADIAAPILLLIGVRSARRKLP